MSQAKDGAQYIVTLCVRCDSDGEGGYTQERMLEQIAELIDRTYGDCQPCEIEEVEDEDDEFEEGYEGDDE